MIQTLKIFVKREKKRTFTCVTLLVSHEKNNMKMAQLTIVKLYY